MNVLGAGAVTVIDASGLRFTDSHAVQRGQPLAMLGLKLDFLTSGCRYDLRSRVGIAPQSAVRIDPLMEPAVVEEAPREAMPVGMRDGSRAIHENPGNPGLSRPQPLRLSPVIRLTVDLGELEDYPSGELPGFNERLLELIPTLQEHGCSYRRAGRLRAAHEGGRGHLARPCARARRDRDPVPGRHAGQLRQDPRCRASRASTTWSTSYAEEPVGLEAGELALQLVRNLLPPSCEARRPSRVRFRARADAPIRLAQRRALGPTTASLVRAAEERDIPGSGSTTEPGAARLRQVPAAHPGHGHQRDPRTSPSRPPATRS